VKYPNPADSVLKFKSIQKQHPVPFYLVCDFESFLTPSNTVDDEEDDVDTSSGRIRTIDEHKVSGFCCHRVTSYPQYQTPPKVYSGADDVMEVFYQHVLNEMNIINWIVADNVEMLPFTPEQEAEFEAATICGNFEKPFTDDNNNVRHHCHISGKFLFPCCNNCNLQLKPIARSKKKRQDKIEKRLKAGKKRHLQTTAEWAADQYEEHFFLPIIFHNLKNYDVHFVIKHFQKKYTEYTMPDQKKKYGNINIIPLNKEKYLQLEIRELRFLDSTSLEELVSFLLKAGKNISRTLRSISELPI